jgi:hypothetical protein
MYTSTAFLSVCGLLAAAVVASPTPTKRDNGPSKRQFTLAAFESPWYVSLYSFYCSPTTSSSIRFAPFVLHLTLLIKLILLLIASKNRPKDSTNPLSHGVTGVAVTQVGGAFYVNTHGDGKPATFYVDNEGKAFLVRAFESLSR